MLPGITLQEKPLRQNRRASLYQGWDRIHRRDVLVKVQAEDGDPDALARFRREAALMVRLRHPGIAAVYQFLDGDPSAAVLEYVSGRSLETLVRAHGSLDLKQAAQVVEEVAAALDCVHAQGIVHRGIAPANILLPSSFFPVPPRHAKLTEFGVARVENDGAAVGDSLETLVYASPEQLQLEAAPDGGLGSDASVSQDIYSLAAVAYFILTGKPPFQAADGSTEALRSVRHRQIFAEPPPLRLHRPELTAEIETVVLRGLAKVPDARYASAGQFAADLRAAVEAAFSDPKQVALASASRRAGVLTGSLVGATALLVGAGLLWKTGELVPASHSQSVSGSRSNPSPLPVPIASSKPPAAVPAPSVAAIPPAAKPVMPVPSAGVPRRRQTSPVVARVPPSAARSRRRAPQIAAVAPPMAILPAASMPKTTAGVPFVVPKISEPKPVELRAANEEPGYLLISATQNIAPLGQSVTMADVPPRALTIDGKSVPVPAVGEWVTVSAGRHWISYYPDEQSKFGPRLGLPVTVASGAHVRQQVPLPLATDRPVTLVADSAATLAPAPVGWYTVSGWAAVPSPSPTQKPTLVRATAQQISVDGKPNLNLALGQWAELPAGKHTITFQPTTGLAVGPKTWDIALDPLAHLDQQIPLPSVPVGWYTVSGWAAVPSPSPTQKPALVRAAAQQVIVDGQPNLTLAAGQWAELPVGKHTITFQPASGQWVTPKTWDITLNPLAHLDQKIPLPAIPVGWYTVSGWIAAPSADPTQPDQKPALLRTSAQQVIVDGQPNLTLAMGQWAELSAGKHTITFQPTSGVNAAPKTWDIALDPLAHFDQHIPLPPAAPLP